jgi:UDP-N-acetylglucosamine 2-epimerase (non-hydrolysing)
MMVVAGTRPEWIKIASVVAALGPAAVVLDTGQHFDKLLSSSVRQALGLQPPELQLAIGGLTRAEQIGSGVTGIAQIATDQGVTSIAVQGDTNSALAGALAANAIDVPLLHIEAGLRSHDRRMPEEHNRVLIDHLADLCAAPTAQNAENLRLENIPAGRICVVGNTVVDAADAMRPDEPAVQRACNAYRLERSAFVLCTLHRPENTEDPAHLAALLRTLEHTARDHLPVVLVVHPRLRSAMARGGLRLDHVQTIDPVPPDTFAALQVAARLWLSDSGGLQEEASILKRPIVVVRRSTERPEILGTFGVMATAGSLEARIAEVLASPAYSRATLDLIPTPFGVVGVGERVAAELRDRRWV